MAKFAKMLRHFPYKGLKKGKIYDIENWPLGKRLLKQRVFQLLTDEEADEFAAGKSAEELEGLKAYQPKQASAAPEENSEQLDPRAEFEAKSIDGQDGLRAYAREHEIDLGGLRKRVDIIDAIIAHLETANAETGPENLPEENAAEATAADTESETVETGDQAADEKSPSPDPDAPGEVLETTSNPSADMAIDPEKDVKTVEVVEEKIVEKPVEAPKKAETKPAPKKAAANTKKKGGEK